VNKKGQFSIIAALLVAVILIAAVVTTYSAIRYNSLEDQPQILSAIDEINLALKEVLGFTVGYYGSVLKITGNSSFAKTLASNYLLSGLENIGDIRPEWGLSFNVTALDLRTNWFTNESYSAGHMAVKYDLTHLGVYGISYSTSCRLDVQILKSQSSSQVCLDIFKDENESLINLGKQNFKFYRYLYSTSTWELVNPSSEPTAYANGTYVLDVPSGIDTSSYLVQIEDTRGIIVTASSFTRYSSTLMWNGTSVEEGFHYVDNNSSDVDTSPNKGAQSNFTAQQYGPDGIYDRLTEAASGTVPQSVYPSFWNGLGSTTLASGTTADLQSDKGQYMSFHSYGSDFSGPTASFGYTTKGGSTRAINDIRGSRFTITQAGLANSISAWLSSGTAFKAQAAIYSSDGSTRIGTTEEKVLSNANGWVTFNFVSQPTLAASTNYVLVVWSNSSNVNIYRDTGTAQRFQASGTYPNWPTSVADQGSQRTYSIYCTYTQANLYTAQVEFTGQSNTPAPWNDLIWAIDSSATTDSVGVAFQLYNFQTGQYATSGDGYMTATLGTTDLMKSQTITTNPAYFKNSTGYWKLKFTAVKTTTTQFDMKIDLAIFSPEVTNYALDIEEQWTNVNATNPRQDLCIKTGALGSESLMVEVRTGSAWTAVINSLQPNTWNNVSVASYISSPTLTIRFKGSNDLSDAVQDNWNIDAVLLKPQPDIGLILSMQDQPAVVELLQNGTMRWLGQNLQLTTQAKPIPPVPVLALHVNQTINGVNQEVPFQIEDWASEYRIPLGLTNNATVFSNRQMIVFLVSTTASKVTIWWNGSDTATQTPLAFTNRYFTDNPSAATLSNGNLTLLFGSFNVRATVGSTSSTAYFMRINSEDSVYGSSLAYVIHHGIVRDIIQQEAEWNGGADNCPNLYANIVITLPANVTYYTYQLRLMFINSTQARTITDLCPIKLTTTLGSLQTQTENGTASSFPIVTNGTGTFYNYTGGSWTAHHWSQFISGTRGSGIMFTDTANKGLYAFDSIAGSAVGALKADNSAKTIELLPVARSSANFVYPLDIAWQGAVVTFDNTTPIYAMAGSTPSGLWILAEYPPTVTVTAES